MWRRSRGGIKRPEPLRMMLGGGWREDEESKREMDGDPFRAAANAILVGSRIEC